MYLLDANVWIAILRKKHPQVAAHYSATNQADIRVCSIVIAELRYGCDKSANPAANRAKLDAVLNPVESLSFDDKAADHFVFVRRHLESTGQVIGSFDMQIAAIALANGCILVTNNTREFKRVPGLIVEDWQIP